MSARMAWLLPLAALACFVLALRLPLGTPGVLLLLLAALVLLLGLVLQRLWRQTGERRPLLDEVAFQRLRAQLEHRRQASEL